MPPDPQEQNQDESRANDRSNLKGRPKRDISPLTITILGGIGTALLAIGNNWFQWFQMQTAETLKLRANLIERALENPSAHERNKNLKFLVTAGLITDSDKKIEKLTDDEIPQRFTFVGTAALTPELQTRLDTGLRDLQDYLTSIGLRTDAQPKVNIKTSGEMRESGM